MFPVFFAWLRWDPSSDIIFIPFLQIPVTWYGFLFASGFWIGFHIFVYMFQRFLISIPEFREGDVHWEVWKKKKIDELKSLKEGDLVSCQSLLDRDMVEPSQSSPLAFAKKILSPQQYRRAATRIALEERFPEIFLSIKERSKNFTETVLLYVMIATILGARLGHVFFYENVWEYLTHPLRILKTWEGGLASHGGIFAVIVSLILLFRKAKKKFPELDIGALLDFSAVPVMLVAAMIRIGNFFNQEILGTVSYQPWAIIFGRPRGGLPNTPCHPAQLYEAIFYLSLFVALFILWKRASHRLQAGQIAGIAIFSSFTFRFFIEFLKPEQSVWMQELGSSLNMGQLLSLPMILLGLFFLLGKRSFDFLKKRTT